MEFDELEICGEALRDFLDAQDYRYRFFFKHYLRRYPYIQDHRQLYTYEFCYEYSWLGKAAIVILFIPILIYEALKDSPETALEIWNSKSKVIRHDLGGFSNVAKKYFKD